MIKQGIKMKERNTAFLLILITTDLHVGILSSRSALNPALLFRIQDSLTILIIHSSHMPWILLVHNNSLAPSDEITETLQEESTTYFPKMINLFTNERTYLRL